MRSISSNCLRPETKSDALENIFDAICLHCGSNNNPSVGQLVDALKTVIINPLALELDIYTLAHHLCKM